MALNALSDNDRTYNGDTLTNVPISVTFADKWKTNSPPRIRTYGWCGSNRMTNICRRTARNNKMQMINLSLNLAHWQLFSRADCQANASSVCLSLGRQSNWHGKRMVKETEMNSFQLLWKVGRVQELFSNLEWQPAVGNHKISFRRVDFWKCIFCVTDSCPTQEFQLFSTKKIETNSQKRNFYKQFIHAKRHLLKIRWRSEKIRR